MGNRQTHGFINVVDAIVDKDMCIGCGICAGICPPRVLDIKFNAFGEFVPLENRTGCLDKCTICVTNCPFWDQDENEDMLADKTFGQTPDIDHRPETGYYLESLVGYSNIGRQRMEGASGGLATWFLGKLLEQDVVDKVICVASQGGEDRLFGYQIFDDIAALQKGSRSAYYPVELSEVIQYVRDNDGRYAVTGLPCFLKGIRLAQRRHRALRKRIVATIGLTCGQMKSRFFAEYLTALVGGNPETVQACHFRVTDPDRPAWNLGAESSWLEDGQIKTGVATWQEGFGHAWRTDYFKPNACNFCDDVYAEAADVVFMDAWLPEYSDDPRGHNLVLNRRAEFSSIWQNGRETGAINVEEIDISRVIRSQKTVIQQKRDGLQFRLLEAEKSNEAYPRKRVAPAKTRGLISRAKWRLKWRIRERTRQVWSEQKDIVALRRDLRWLELQMSFFNRLGRLKGRITG